MPDGITCPATLGPDAIGWMCTECGRRVGSYACPRCSGEAPHVCTCLRRCSHPDCAADRPASYAELRLQGLSAVAAGFIRDGFEEARHGEVRAMDGTAYLGNLVTREDAAILAEAKARLAGGEQQ